MARIAGAVILYNPDGDLLKRINSYLGQLEKLYVIDNSEQPTQSQFDDKKIVYIANRANLGIAAGLNQAAKLAIQDGVEWLLTMDQDSFFDKNIISYLECFSRYPGKEIVACFGVEFLEKQSDQDTCKSARVSRMITSGTMMNLNAFREIGPFNEDLFIDQVDFEYCYRAGLKGFSNIQFTNIFLTHALGTSSVHRSLKNLSTSKRSLHSPIRLYYMTRNFLYVQKRYKSHFPSEIRHSKNDLLNRIKNNLLYGKNKTAVLSNIFSGVFDYYRGRMGRKS